MESASSNLQKSKYAVQLDAASVEDLIAVIDLEVKKNVVQAQFPQRRYVAKIKKLHVIWNKYRKKVKSYKFIIEFRNFSYTICLRL